MIAKLLRGYRVVIALFYIQCLMCAMSLSDPGVGTTPVPDYVHDAKLRQHLLNDYDKDARPSRNNKEAITVDFDITLLKVNGLDESLHTLSTSFFLYKAWHDPRLTWNGTEFGGLTSINVPVEKIWKPDVTLFNIADQVYAHTYGVDATLKSNGFVFWTPMITANTWCKINFVKFPFDTQVCYLTFGSWIYEASQLKFRLAINPNATEVDGHIFSYESAKDMEIEWQVKQFKQRHRLVKYVESLPEWSEFSAELTLRRLGRYYQNLLVAPIVLLSILVPIVFLLPPDATEKPILGCLILLCITILLISLGPVTQPAHYNMPQLVMFYVSTMILASVSVLCSAGVCNIAKRSKHFRGVPAWLAAIFLGRCGLRRVLCVESYSPVSRFDTLAAIGDTNNPDDDDGGTEMTGPADNSSHKELREIRKCLHAIANRLYSDESITNLTREWYEISRVLDRFLIVVFYFILFLTALAFLL